MNSLAAGMVQAGKEKESRRRGRVCMHDMGNKCGSSGIGKEIWVL